MMKQRIPLYVVILLFFGFLASELCGFTFSVPSIPHLDTATKAAKEVSKAQRPISDEEEYYIGRAVAAKILSSYPLLENRALTGYVNLIGQTMALNSDTPQTYGGYHFAILDTNEINAFACPGGTILITRGMISATRNEDELAAVLAHEVAHIHHRDGVASIKSARWTEALTVMGAETARSYTPAQVSQLVRIFEGSVEDVFKTLVVNGYGRSQEYQADETAMRYLSKGGYNPASLRDFLLVLASQGNTSSGGILKTHPGTAERIENIAHTTPSRKSDESTALARSARFNTALRK
jgi:predicted Zn-dependent protease